MPTLRPALPAPPPRPALFRALSLWVVILLATLPGMPSPATAAALAPALQSGFNDHYPGLIREPGQVWQARLSTGGKPPPAALAKTAWPAPTARADRRPPVAAVRRAARLCRFVLAPAPPRAPPLS